MLLPHEHGAYGQLLFPVLSALAIGSPVRSAYLLAVSMTAAFLAHESVLVLLGQRGVRATREQAADARRSLMLFGGVGLVTGLLALWTLPRGVLVWLALPLLLAVLVGLAVYTRRERTTGGEVLVGAALSSAALPVALAGGVEMTRAVTLVVVFACVFATATVAVRAVIGRVSKAGGPSPIVAALCALAVVAGVAAGGRAGYLARAATWAALPVCAVALSLSLRPPSPKQLRVVGWTLVGATALTAIVLVAALR